MNGCQWVPGTELRSYLRHGGIESPATIDHRLIEIFVSSREYLIFETLPDALQGARYGVTEFLEVPHRCQLIR